MRYLVLWGIRGRAETDSIDEARDIASDYDEAVIVDTEEEA